MNSKKLTLLLMRILEKITSDKKRHAFWLNTLSYLEYIGTRKIIKALPAEKLNETLLDHISEEARHSLFFKRQAKKLFGKSLFFHSHEMIVSEAAEDYFQSIDHKAKEFSRSNPVLNYLYTTYIVESRAILSYSIYNEILKRKNFGFSLNSILKEEEKHLEFVYQAIKKLDLFYEETLETLKEFEHRQYFSLLFELEKEMFPSSFRKRRPFLKEKLSYQQNI